MWGRKSWNNKEKPQILPFFTKKTPITQNRAFSRQRKFFFSATKYVYQVRIPRNHTVNMSNLKEAGTLLGQVVFGANNFLWEKWLSFLWKWRNICIFFLMQYFCELNDLENFEKKCIGGREIRTHITLGAFKLWWRNIMQQLYQTQQSLWVSGRILSHEINFPGSNPTQSYCVHVEFKGNWYTFGPGVFWRKQVIIRKMTIFFVKVKENLHFFNAIFLRITRFKKFRKKFFFAYPIQHTRWSAFSWARKLAGVPSVGRGRDARPSEGPRWRISQRGIPRWKRFFSEKVTSECVVRDISILQY